MTTTRHTLLLLGREHPEFGAPTVESTGAGRSAAAISAGAHPGIPSMQHKGDRGVPNEDALALVEEGPRTLLLVADAHHGHEASHVLAEKLAEGPIPDDPETLRTRVTTLSSEHARTTSRTTLSICVVDRAAGRAFGLQWGDSSIATVTETETVRRTMPVPTYVDADTVSTTPPQRFAFDLKGVRFVLAYTDGVNECHYRSPATSIQPHHVQMLARNAEGDVTVFADMLARRALRGVEGNPGGQDNIALGVTRVVDEPSKGRP